MKNRKLSAKLKFVLLFVIIAVNFAMHFRVFNKDLMSMHVWRQTQTQSTIVNFYEEGTSIINPTRNARGDSDGIFRMEFPIMQWTFAQVYKVFGNHTVISRILSFLIAILSILGMFKIAKILFKNDIVALLTAWAFMFAPTFFYHSINPMPDNLAICFAIWGLYHFFLWFKEDSKKAFLFSAVLICLSALTKLPFILFFSLPLGLFISKGFRNKSTVLRFVLYSLFAIPALTWYLWVIPTWEGNGITSGIIDFKKETILKALDNFAYHAYGNLPEMLINFASCGFFVAGTFFIFKNKHCKKALFGILAIPGILLVLYLFFESNMVGKSHDYYLYPFLPLIFIIVGYGLIKLLSSERKVLVFVTFVFVLMLPLTTHLRLAKRWSPESPGFNKDLLIYKQDLVNAVPNDALCIAGSDKSGFIFFYYINKKGWCYQEDYFNYNKFKDYIEKGAKYLYTDSKSIISNPKFKKHFKKSITQKGSIHVFELNP